MQKKNFPIAAFILLHLLVKAQTDNELYPIDTIQKLPSFIITDPREVLKNDGELITVQGCVVRAVLKEQVKGKPVFLDMFVAFPNNILTVAIWEEDQAQFLPAAAYHQKMVRVTGRAKKKTFVQPGKASQERVTISLHNPRQITILGDCQK